MIHVPAYWPQLGIGRSLTVVFDPALTQKWSFDIERGQYRLDESDENGEWICAWFYVVSERGVVETGNAYPNYAALRRLRKERRTNYATGYENLWGLRQSIGSVIDQRVAQAGLFRLQGRNYVRFEAADIELSIGEKKLSCLKMFREEAWGSAKKRAYYYMAPGLGFVGFDWLGDSGQKWRQRAISCRSSGGDYEASGIK